MSPADTTRPVLPLSLPPRGLSRVAAATYVGVSPTTFDRMVADGLMPKPFRVYSRVLWDRVQLDEAIVVLRDSGESLGGDDQWNVAP